MDSCGPELSITAKPDQQQSAASAGQSDSDAPATKADVERYLDAIHAREMMKQMTMQISKPMHR